VRVCQVGRGRQRTSTNGDTTNKPSKSALDDDFSGERQTDGRKVKMAGKATSNTPKQASLIKTGSGKRMKFALNERESAKYESNDPTLNRSIEKVIHTRKANIGLHGQSAICVYNARSIVFVSKHS
jgi:hypothetical protein